MQTIKKKLFNTKNTVSSINNPNEKQFSKSLNQMINATAKLHRIKIDPKRLLTLEGKANYNCRLIRIPKVTDVKTFMIALHEIGHLVNGRHRYNFYNEYLAEKWAINCAKALHINCTSYVRNAKGYVLHNLATAFNRGLNIDNVPVDVRKFIKTLEPNLDSWKEHKKVYIEDWHSKEINIQKLK